MLSIDTTQESIVESSSKIIKLASTQKETPFQQEFVKVWQQLVEQSEKPLALVYLANDLIQRSKIKGNTNFWQIFKPELTQTLERLMLKVNAIDSQAILKVVDVWKNRQVYDDEFLSTLKTKIYPDEKCV